MADRGRLAKGFAAGHFHDLDVPGHITRKENFEHENYRLLGESWWGQDWSWSVIVGQEGKPGDEGGYPVGPDPCPTIPADDFVDISHI